MNNNDTTRDLFFTKTDWNETWVQDRVNNVLTRADDGELFLEYCQSEAFTFDDGYLKNSSFDTMQGFGLRAICEEATAYAHTNALTPQGLEEACNSVMAVTRGHQGTPRLAAPKKPARALYAKDNPLGEIPFEKKIKLLQDIDAYVRSKDNRVRQVTARLAGEWQAVRILRLDGNVASDIRPLVRLDISVVVGENERQESGYAGGGGRLGYSKYLDTSKWQQQADEALRHAVVNLESVPAPAGEMDVLLASGWPGILLHEAVGHGLEGDFNRKKTSAFAGLMGKRVAAKGVTVVDDGTLEDRRGSLTVDDEGTPTSSTVLIEDGILKGYMQDRMNARLMGDTPTGNGRRESFAHAPLPRMTNTYMKSGSHEPEEMIKKVKNGLMAVSFGGGQVDITNGKFVFSCTEAYKIENGKVTAPVKGATLIGNGPDVLTRVAMVGNDMQLDSGIGTCGKAGQGVPVGVGQPSLLVKGLTVGGTAT